MIPIVISTLSGGINSTDWTYRHSVWVDKYIQGDFSPIYYYLPLFHFIMIPFVLINFPVELFQIFFASITTFGILYFAYKMEKDKVVLLVAILLASSIAYVQIAGAMMPQGFDYFLFPLAVIFFFKNDFKKSLPLLMLNFFIHHAGLIFIVILMLFSLLTKRYKWFKVLLVITILLAPIFYYYHFVACNLVFPNAYDHDAQIEWEKQFIDPPWKFFVFSGFMTWLLFPLAIYKLIRNKIKLTETQVLYTLWILAFLPLPFVNVGIWRMISYQIVPLTLLVASITSDDV